jgi:hypothetical protein
MAETQFLPLPERALPLEEGPSGHRTTSPERIWSAHISVLAANPARRRNIQPQLTGGPPYTWAR